MESTTSYTIFNLKEYFTSKIKEAALALLKDFIPPNFTPTVTANPTSDSEYSSPAAMQLFNMCSKKQGFQFSSAEELGEALIKNIKDDEKISKEMKVYVFEQEAKKGKGEKKGAKEGEENKEKDGDAEAEKKKEQGKKGKKKEKKIPKIVYINIYISNEWAESEAANLLKNGIHLKSIYQNHHITVDFSSPNIAKEMHVGHLRSTILGESICRILEFLGNKVERVNHVGDWGTQFGMLIAYLEEINPNYSNEPEKCGNIRDLEEFYKAAKNRFDKDSEFKKKSQLKTVDLQKGDEAARNAWKFICQISRDNFNEIYKRLGITLKEVGESFYDPLCRKIIDDLTKKGIIIEDQGAKIIRVDGFKNPMLMVKSDGGIGYDTTDLAALYYRINELKSDWIIYVVATEQSDHFKILFKAGEKCGFVDPSKVRLDHMGFGLVTGKDGKKIATRKGGNLKLIDLLQEAAERSAAEMEKRNEKIKEEDAKLSPEYIKEACEKVGYSAIKYFDLKQFRVSGYKFDWDKMLDIRGNSAVYLIYSYVRICAVFRKNNLTQEELEKLAQTEKIVITEKAEKKLLMHLLRFNDIIDDVLKDLAINILCDFTYEIAGLFSEFYESCKIANNNSRILLSYLCQKIMKTSFDLLGLTPVEKI